MRALAALLILFLAACDKSTPGPTPSGVTPLPPVVVTAPGTQSLSPSAWVVQVARGVVPALAAVEGGGWYFNFPTCELVIAATPIGPCSIGYVVLPVNLALSSTLAVKGRVAVTGAPVFDYRTNTDNTCVEDPPKAHVRLYMQQKGDDYSGAGPFAFYRWFSNVPVWQLQAGEFELNGDLTVPKNWTSVNGITGDQNVGAFQTALANLQAIGVVYGGGCFYAHGAFIDAGSGSAAFVVNSVIAK